MTVKENITGYVVVCYPEGEMKQASIFFDTNERHKAVAFFEKLDQDDAELLARIEMKKEG